jgi:hypothetical protein
VVRVPGRRAGTVSTAALVCYRPGYRPRVLWRQHVWRRTGDRRSFTWRGYRDLLKAAHYRLPGGRIVLVWDNLNTHRDRRLGHWIEATDWLTVTWLPPYAPELNPVEGVWSVLKTTVLANLAATGLDHLVAVIRRGLKRLQYHPEVINGCLAATGLTITAITN